MEYAGLDLHKSFCQTKIGTKEGEMLKGIEVKQLRRFADERGFFTEILRKDWQLLEDEIVQANFSISYPGIVRAWHRHLRGQVDCFVVLKFLKGALKICAYDDEYKKIDIYGRALSHSNYVFILIN